MTDARIALVNIDDFREVLRSLKAEGYSARRQGKLAVWKVYPAELSTALLKTCLIQEIYVDTSRTIPRGMALTMNVPKWDLKIRAEYKYEPPDIVWRYHYYGKP